jgi:hypothetical protein
MLSKTSPPANADLKMTPRVPTFPHKKLWLHVDGFIFYPRQLAMSKVTVMSVVNFTVNVPASSAFV